MAGAGLAAVWPPSPVPSRSPPPAPAGPVPSHRGAKFQRRDAAQGPGRAPREPRQGAAPAAPQLPRGSMVSAPGPLPLPPPGGRPLPCSPPGWGWQQPGRGWFCWDGAGVDRERGRSGRDGLVQPGRDVGMGPVRPGKGSGPFGPELGWVRMGLGSGCEGSRQDGAGSRWERGSGPAGRAGPGCWGWAGAWTGLRWGMEGRSLPGAVAGAGALSGGRGVRLVGGCWGQGPSGWKDLGTPGCSWAGDWHCPCVAGAAPVPPGTALSVMVISLISSCLLED